MDILFVAISIATVVIAVYAVLNYKLIKLNYELISKIHFFNVNITEFNDSNRRLSEASVASNHEILQDLLRAVVISNLSENKNSLKELKTAIDIFNSEYFGKTQIFSSETKKSLLNR